MSSKYKITGLIVFVFLIKTPLMSFWWWSDEPKAPTEKNLIATMQADFDSGTAHQAKSGDELEYLNYLDVYDRRGVEYQWSRAFPVIAQGFDLIGMVDFQNFMQEKFTKELRSQGFKEEFYIINRLKNEAEHFVVDACTPRFKETLEGVITNKIDIDFLNLTEPEIKESWIEKSSLTYPGDNELSIFMYVIRHVDMFNSLDFKIYIHEATPFSQHYALLTTLLMQAANEDLYYVTLLLIHLGADINSTNNKFGQTLLFSADGYKVANLLIDRGLDVNAIDDLGHTPLWGAVVNNLDEVAQVLIDRGADINLTGDPDDSTPLEMAFMMKKMNGDKILRMMVDVDA